MRWRFGTLDWSEFEGRGFVMVTLTYGPEWPKDGRLVKRQLDRFLLYWERYWREPAHVVWTMEFQRRGAPHFHIYGVIPEHAAHLGDFRAWARKCWHGLVGGNDHHESRGVHVVGCTFGSIERNMARVGDYFWQHNAKAAQKEVPEDFEHPGRFYGHRGVRVVEYPLEVDERTYVHARRAIRTLRAKINQKAGGRKERARGGLAGTWSISTAGGIETAVRLVEWAGAL